MTGRFGPTVIIKDDGSLRAICGQCVFLVGNACTHVKPYRRMEDLSTTPDWCEMRASMLKDVADMLAREKKRKTKAVEERPANGSSETVET